MEMQMRKALREARSWHFLLTGSFSAQTWRPADGRGRSEAHFLQRLGGDDPESLRSRPHGLTEVWRRDEGRRLYYGLLGYQDDLEFVIGAARKK
jgi:hypothetical protein